LVIITDSLPFRVLAVKHTKGFGKLSQGSNIFQLFAQAKAHRRAGRFHNAEVLYRQILKLQADHPEALQDLGGLLCLLGNPTEGEVLFSKLVALKPDDPIAHYNLGMVQETLQAFSAAKSSYGMAVALAPNLVEAHNNLGDLALGENQFSEAHKHFQKAIFLKPNFAEAHCGLGYALFQLGQQQNTQDIILKAETHLRKAIVLKPDFADGHYHLGSVLLEMGQHQGSLSKLTEAIAQFQKALTLQPELNKVRLSLGAALTEIGQFSAARVCYDQAIAQEPSNTFLYYRSHLLLLLGDFRAGWFGFDRHPQAQSYQGFVQPYWDGSALLGKRILLRTKHGFGDAIQFIRYVPLVKALGAMVVIVECHPAEERLFRTCQGIDQLVLKGDALPKFDVHTALYYLPQIFRTDLETIPAPLSYLSTPEACHLPEDLQAQLSNAASLKVGVVWSSKLGCKRRCPLSLFEPLLQLPGLSWFSLYKGDYGAELEPYSAQIVDIGSHVQDFADTAWAIAQLDLVITVDTSVAHLAGAMGKPTWVLLPFVPDWRWLLDREDSPWYPTARLFRQPRLGDWFLVIKKVESSLLEMSEGTALGSVAKIDRRTCTDKY
jgi:Flp pilus assembly protein TadD